MKTETAITWLINCMPDDMLKNDYVKEIFKTAKEKEKQQIIEAVISTTKDCWQSLAKHLNMPSLKLTEEDLKNQQEEAEEYYKQTFKTK